MRTMIHPETGQTLTRQERPETISHGIYSRTINLAGWYPEDDGDAILDPDDQKAYEEVAGELRARYIARLKEMRKRLDLTQEAASNLIGGGIRSFQRYESGRQPTAAAVRLIEILCRHPELVDEVREIEVAEAA
ncbi:type II TA system antitoxin MqsA family protein [Novosphingobium sp. TCA1]|uniref:type II TA system antitoxin MqsA family protein n=1 Tax=Novosphingobium sp. TCA1 TaxID=2682474 RepID=UPI001309FD1C|nr:type II TA system antitoxin MqsA family protein [Novosphingobium sp. TCA1]GFE77527.1 hypothetical protein NTCA1_51760 [Novosphingobium sp. TCA1]